MMFMSGLRAGQFKTVKLPSFYLSSRHFWITLAVYLGSLSCWKTKFLPIRAFPTGTVWWMSICLYLGAVRLSEIFYRWPTRLYVIEPQTCRVPPSFTVGKTQSYLYVPLSSSASHILPQTVSSCSDFFSSVNITFLHCTGNHVL